MFKSRLQEYCQKARILPPIYQYASEGSSHEPRFHAVVIVDGVQHVAPNVYKTLKQAKHAAAKTAFQALATKDSVHLEPIEASGLCKNVLQELAQRVMSLPVPVYYTERNGDNTFYSTVDVAGALYKGRAAKRKKDAEVNAARMALLSILSKAQPSRMIRSRA